eukprot:2843270-Alexandrium_andersonii.AAC.1
MDGRARPRPARGEQSSHPRAWPAEANCAVPVVFSRPAPFGPCPVGRRWPARATQLLSGRVL